MPRKVTHSVIVQRTTETFTFVKKEMNQPPDMGLDKNMMNLCKYLKSLCY